MKCQRLKNMEYIAIAKNIKMSPRKVRLVADDVKKQKITVALASLMVMNQRASGPIKKAIESAIANAVNNKNADRNNLVIKEIAIEGASALKRYHFAARGRTRPYKRRMSNIRVVLADMAVAVPAPAKIEAKTEEKKEEIK